jgi:hypothetical protein
MDLFTPSIRVAELGDVERRKALALLQTLLIEAAAKPGNNRGEGAGDQQDHA